METVTYLVFGSLAVAMALAVVTCRSPLRSALALIVAQCALAALYVGLAAPFVAAMQVLVYAGAIMVLFLFVIMLLNLGPDNLPQVGYLAVSKALGAGAGAWVMFVVAREALRSSAWPSFVVDGSVANVGALLMGPYLIPFEATSVLLLAASLGAIVLGLKRLT